jgi:hypothetical protein
MNNNLQRALAASLANAEAKNAANYQMAQNASRGVAENNLYMDAAMEMRESMFDKPDARRRLIAGTGLDTLMLQFPGEELERLRDHLLETRYDPAPADTDPMFLEAQGMLEAYGIDDPLVTRLQEVHESMLVEEEQRKKEIQNAINRAAAEETERQRQEAEAAKPVVPNRNAARAQRMAFLNRFQKKNNTAKNSAAKNGGDRRRSRNTRRRRRVTRRGGKN